MLVQPEINQKKLILSTTEVSKLLLSKGRRKINESILSHGTKTLNNIDLTELASQINIKLSKEGENANDKVNVTSLVDQSLLRPFGDKSILYRQRSPFNPLDKSGFLGVKDNMNFLSRIDKSQIGNENIEQNQDIKGKRKLLRLDTTEIGLDKNMNIKISNYFPYYDKENNLYLENSTKLKNFVVVFYFIIEKTTFLLIRKLDKKLIPLYFWNREEDAKQFGINYSQINTPGLNFKNFDNFKETFYQGRQSQQTISKMRIILKEKKIEYEQNIEKIKNEYELKLKELEENIEILNSKINEYENDIKELIKTNNDMNNEINNLKLINEKLLKENKNMKNKDNNINLNNNNINNNNKKDKVQIKRSNNISKSFYKSKSNMNIITNRKYKINGNLSNKNNKIKEKEINEEDNSFPKLEDYTIEDEEEKINKIKNVVNIKTYGERKKYYENYNTTGNINNNFFVSIKDSSNKKEKIDLDSFKNKFQSGEINYRIIQESNSTVNNKIDYQEEEEEYSNY